MFQMELYFNSVHLSLFTDYWNPTVRNPASDFLVQILKTKKMWSYVNVLLPPDTRKSSALYAGLQVSPTCLSEYSNI